MAGTGGPLTPLVGGSALATGQWEALWQGAPEWLREALAENGVSDLTVLANLVEDLGEVDRVVRRVRVCAWVPAACSTPPMCATQWRVLMISWGAPREPALSRAQHSTCYFR